MARHVHPNIEWNRIRPDTITEEDLRIPDVLMSPYMYQQGFIFTIDHEGRDHRHNSFEDYGDAIALGRCTKIEGMERLSQNVWKTCDMIVNGPYARDPFSCHVFLSPKDSPSFPDHTDPDGVFLYVVKGTKTKGEPKPAMILGKTMLDMLICRSSWLN